MRMRAIVLAGLAALAGCAGAAGPTTEPAAVPAAAAVDWTQAQQVDIVLVDFAFQPSRIVLQRGQPYRLRLRDSGSGGHNFDAPAFFRTAALRDGPAAAEIRGGHGALELGRGEVKEIDLVPTEAGSFPLECSHLLHATIFGMTGEIVVE